MQIVSRVEPLTKRAGLSLCCTKAYFTVLTARLTPLESRAAALLGRVVFPGIIIVSCDRCPVAPRASPVPDLCSSVMPDTTDGHSLRFDRVRRLKVTAADICAC